MYSFHPFRWYAVSVQETSFLYAYKIFPMSTNKSQDHTLKVAGHGHIRMKCSTISIGLWHSRHFWLYICPVHSAWIVGNKQLYIRSCLHDFQAAQTINISYPVCMSLQWSITKCESDNMDFHSFFIFSSQRRQPIVPSYTSNTSSNIYGRWYSISNV